MMRGSLCAALVLASSALGHAAGFELVEQSTTAAGTAGAGSSRDGDPSAAWFNPAALADGAGFRAGLGLALAQVDLHAQSAPGAAGNAWSGDTANDLSTPPHLYLSYAQDAWAVALSTNVPFGGQVKWPTDWAQRFEIISSRPQFFRIAAAFAWDFGFIRVSAGPHIDVGSLEIIKATNHIIEEGQAHLRLEGFGFGGHVSLYAAPVEGLGIGLVYKSRTSLSLAGQADFEVPATFAGRFPDQGVRSSWTLPDRLVVGASYRFMPELTVLADVSLTLWSVNGELRLDFDEEVTDDIVQRNAWQDTVALRLGIEGRPLDDVTLRGGFFVDGLGGPAAPSATLTPASPDATRVGFSLGASYDFHAFSVDAFYAYLHLLDRQSDGLDAPEAIYSGEAHLFGLGFRFAAGRWPAHDADS